MTTSGAEWCGLPKRPCHYEEVPMAGAKVIIRSRAPSSLLLCGCSTSASVKNCPAGTKTLRTRCSAPDTDDG